MRKVVVVLTGLTLLVPGSARAGGWWSFVDVRPVAVAAGQRVVVHEHVTFQVVPRTRGPFFVYLLRGLDDSFFGRAVEHPRRWTLGGAEAIRVGRVQVRGAEARATFRARGLPPGRYAVAFCDAGCRRPLGDTMPGVVTVVADPATAGLVQRVERLDRRVDQQADALWQARDERDRLQAGVRGLRRQLAAQNDAGSRPWYGSAGSGAALALAGAALLAAVGAVLACRRQRRPDQGQTPAVAKADAVRRDESVPESNRFRDDRTRWRHSRGTVRDNGLQPRPTSAVADRERGSSAPAVSGGRSRRRPASRS